MKGYWGDSMKSNIDKDEMKKRRDKDVLSKAKMAGEGGATSESFRNDPRINRDENQEIVNEEKSENDKS